MDFTTEAIAEFILTSPIDDLSRGKLSLTLLPCGL
jgi:hypothetical protein